MSERNIINWPLDKIEIAANRRPVSQETVAGLVESIKEVGFRGAIEVRPDGRLVAGRHRVEAVARLGWDTIPTLVFDGDDLDAEIFEINENLKRSELTVVQRSKQTARLKTLYEQKHPEARHGENQHTRGVATVATPRPSFVADTASATGRSTRAVELDAQIGRDLDDEAAGVLDGTPLANRTRDLQEISRLEPEQQRQVAKALADTGATKLADAPTTEAEILRRASEIRKQRTEQRRQDRVEKLAEIEAGTSPMPTGKTYHVVYCDPPWRYQHAASESRAIENHYPTTSHDDLKAMPVGELAADDAVLVMWATSPKLEEALDLIKAWGFTYKTSMVWTKGRMGMGYYARIEHELVLIATRGTPPTPAPGARPRSVIDEPVGEHSAKPSVVRDHLDAMWPAPLRRIELFARTAPAGWDVWGFEAPMQSAP